MMFARTRHMCAPEGESPIAPQLLLQPRAAVEFYLPAAELPALLLRL